MGCGQQMKREKSGKEWTHTYIYISKKLGCTTCYKILSPSPFFFPPLSLSIYIYVKI